MDAKQIKVSGLVQGVGFRPFVFNLATQHQLHGWVCNTSSGVEIAVEGETQPLSQFLHALQHEAPPLAHIDSIKIEAIVPNGFTDFTIRSSVVQSTAFQPISPDIALCPDCERELFDPANRRYLYPFINCTNCGPRFTIIRDLPYDRPATTMAQFHMCQACHSEYTDPRDRRFHAQPNACEACGPRLEIKDQRSKILAPIFNLQSVLITRRLLREGKIIALKGLGGFHLACDAANAAAVHELRQRKGRVDKPFAVMTANIETAEALCELNDEERRLLTSHEKPIVLLKTLATPTTNCQQLATNIAPHLNTLGVMLPYTPLHHLLLNQTDPTLHAELAPRVLVMTSGNYSEEPIATQNEEALQRLAPFADAFLLHNRDIHQRCDDSVVKVIGKTSPKSPITNSQLLFTRRARGYAPYPVRLPFTTPPLLAVGGELKNTFCVARERYAFLSQHIGDMENVETLNSFEQSVELLTRLFRVQPQLIAHDLHPDYLSTRYAQRLAPNPPLIAVQHHHAHIAACMAENGLPNEPVIGLAFDGTGYGTDGAIWGGEVLIADYQKFTRAAQLEYLPLPGGDAATRHPWRIAVGYAAALDLDVHNLPFMRELDPRAIEIVRAQVAKKLNAPHTSSMGRLFDTVTVLAGGRIHITYEAQAAIELEAAAAAVEVVEALYPYHWEHSGEGRVIRLHDLLAAIIAEARRDVSLAHIGAKFHHTLAQLVSDLCQEIKNETGLTHVALSGGVWQNELLLTLVSASLTRGGFTVYTHRLTPANDGGLALGQAAVAAHSIN